MSQFQTSKSRKRYFFLNHQGECLNLPNFKEVEYSDLSNQPYILIPDNNVCIHVSDLYVSKQQKIKTIKAENFLEYTRRFLFKINQQMYEDVDRRATRRISMSEAELHNETETTIDTSSQYIAEFTKELEITQCKGFGR